MRWNEFKATVSPRNDFSRLKWLVSAASIFTTVLALILLLSFRSNFWFSYELIYANNRSATGNNTSFYSQLLEYGNLGLWSVCVGHYDQPITKCDIWINETRPHSFYTVIILVSCALLLANLTVFPSWATTILIVYNFNNRYVGYIVVFLWLLFFLTLSIAFTLTIALLTILLTPFHSPGTFVIGTTHLFFYSGSGLIYLGLGNINRTIRCFDVFLLIKFDCIFFCLATLFALISLIMVMCTVIWQKIIQIRLAQAERDLLKQMTDDGFQPGWHKMVLVPRTPNEENSQPPPYSSDQRSLRHQ